MATATLKKKLALAKKKFKEAKNRADEMGTGFEVPDGRYRTRLIEARGPEESQGSGRLQFVMVFEILDGEYKGEKLYRYQGLEPGKNSSQDYEDVLAFAIRDIARFGYELEDVEDIEDVLAEIDKEKPEVVIKAVTKNDFQNYNIVTVEEADDAGEDEEEEEEEEEDGEDVESDEEDGDAEDEESEEEEDDDEGEEEEEEEVDEDPEEEPEDDEEEDDEEEEPEDDEEEDEDTIELEEGSVVAFEVKGKKLHGEIVEILDDDKVKVKASNGKTYKKDAEDLEEYVEPKEKSPAKKKPAKKAPAKKAAKKKPAKKAGKKKGKK